LLTENDNPQALLCFLQSDSAMAETSKEADELATVVTEGSDKLPEWQKLQRIDRI
jgi:hypothetical protein